VQVSGDGQSSLTTQASPVVVEHWPPSPPLLTVS